MGYTAVTIIAYFLMNGDLTSTVGMLTKVIEVTLLVLLWREMQPVKK